jgi:hypothetical protein
MVLVLEVAVLLAAVGGLAEALGNQGLAEVTLVDLAVVMVVEAVALMMKAPVAVKVLMVV